MNNRAPELSPEARRIISAASGFDEPTPDDRERVKARWLASVAAVAGVSSLTEAARAAGGLGWGAKVAGAALAIVAGAIGLYVVTPEGGLSEGAPERAARGGRAASPALSESALEGSAAPEGDPGSVASARAPGWSGETYERHQKTSATRQRPGETPALEPSVEAPVTAFGPEAEALGANPGAGVLPVIGGAPLAAEEPELLVAGEPEVVSEPVAAVAPGGSTQRARKARALKRAAPQASAPRAIAVAAPLPRRSEAPASSGGAPAEAGSGAGAKPGGQLGDELALLSEVRRHVQGDTPARALELLSGYGARFEQPILGMEADALRVDALCRTGERGAARESAEVFQRKWPDSPLGGRVRAACP